jgi:hypothetical protein
MVSLSLSIFLFLEKKINGDADIVLLLRYKSGLKFGKVMLSIQKSFLNHFYNLLSQ